MPKSLSISKLLALIGVAVVLTLFLASSAAHAEDANKACEVSGYPCSDYRGAAEVVVRAL